MAKTRLPAYVAEAVIERSGGICEARRYDVCIGRAAHLHHRRFRSGGEDHSIPNLIHICDACHTWIHMNKKQAIALGWAISSHTTSLPSEVQVSYRGRPSMLGLSGEVATENIFYQKQYMGRDPWQVKEKSK